MSYKHNEDTRVKIPLIAHLTKLGYKYREMSKYNIDRRNNIFRDIFKESLEKINKRSIQKTEIDKLLSEINELSKINDLGKSLYERLVSQSSTEIKLIDFNNYKNNSFSTVSELKFLNKGEFRPDITILINGIPIVIFEVKRPNVTGLINKEFKRNTDRLNNPKFNHFFNLIQLILISNNMEYESKIDANSGSYYTTPNSEHTSFNKFREEEELKLEAGDIQDLDIILKDNKQEGLEETIEFKTNIDKDRPANKFATSILSKERLMFILQYGLTYLSVDKKLENGITTINQKHIIRYQQLFSIFKCKEMLDKGIKKGIFWETQGSGKTALSLYLANYITNYYSKGKLVKFYFIVDRLELLNQTVSEFAMRGITAKTVNSKKELEEEFKSTKNGVMEQKIDITVVNIHKFDEFEIENNSYSPDIQRFYIMDEAHRSYNPSGSFLKNLLNSDKSAIHIALTGTPLISQEYNSTDIFGNYIYKYYYDKSIKDGYTLRIMKEKVITAYKEKIDRVKKDILKNTGDTENINKNLLYTNETYCKELGSYISEDFINFRKSFEDNTLGGMVVCNSKEQCKVLTKWFKGNSTLTAEYVVDDVDKHLRKQIQNDYKKGQVDILFVYNMLLTGFDAPRLKRLYLLRVIKKHNLLQALTRVNRPYNNPSTNVPYKFGFVIDFAEIENEFNEINLEYLKELEKEMTELDPNINLSDTFCSEESLKEELEEINEVLSEYSLDNLEFFEDKIRGNPLNELYKIKGHLLSLERLYKEFSVVNKDFDHNIDIERVQKAIKRVEEIIRNKSIRESLNEDEYSKALLTEVLNNFDFKFEKTFKNELEVLPDGSEKKEEIQKLCLELEKNLDTNDKEYKSLYDKLKEILGSFFNENGEYICISLEELTELTNKAELQNDENNRLMNIYGTRKYMTVYKRLKETPELESIPNQELEKILFKINAKITDMIENNSNLKEEVLKKDIKSLINKTLKETPLNEHKRTFRNVYIEAYFYKD